MIVGIDFDTYKAALCLLWPAGPEFRIAAFRPASASGEAAAFRALVGAGLAVRLALGTSVADDPAAEPVFVVERGFGSSRRADFALGAFYGVIVATLAQHYPRGRVVSMTPAEWKKATSAACGVETRAGGRGNGALKKDVAHVYVRRVLAESGVGDDDLAGRPSDILDAFALAWTQQRKETTT